MMSLAAVILAMAVAPSLAIPPPSFGFPEAPNDTMLAVAFPQPGGTNIFVKEAELFGISVPAQEPNIGVLTSRFRSLAEYDGAYVVLMVDPDASYPETPTKRFILHWLQANLTQSPSMSGNDEIGHPLTNESTPVAPVVPYARPAPPTNSSAHRYIIYAFQQPSNFSIPDQWSGLSASNRTSFNLTNFINDTYLGTPAAANFFYASNQSDIPATFTAAPGGEYPSGNGMAVSSGDPYKPTAASQSTTASSTGAAAMITGAGALLGAGLVGIVAIM